MMIRPFLALVAKDLRVFCADRHAMLLCFASPIALASFMAIIFGGAGTTPLSSIPLVIVDEDGGTVSAAILAGSRTDPRVRATLATRGPGIAAVRRGEAALAVVIPHGFGESAASALVGEGDAPILRYYEDPIRRAEASLAEGLLTRVILEAVSRDLVADLGSSPKEDLVASLFPDTGPVTSEFRDRAEFLALFEEPDGSAGAATQRAGDRAELLEAFPGLATWYSPRSEQPVPATPSSAKGLAMPFEGLSQSVFDGGADGERGALAAHAFAGMAVQFVLFSAIECGVGLLVERERGLWKRLRVAPVSRATLLAAKIISSLVVSNLILSAVFGFGAIAFGIQIGGSFSGFVLVSVSFAWMAANFGLLVAALGRSPQGARSVAILAVLVMVMLGGGWIPGFLFPAWLQRLTPAIPARWAIDGFDGVLSRGYTFADATPMVLASFGFGAAFGTLALASFRWAEPS